MHLTFSVFSGTIRAGIVRNPSANPPADILVDNPRIPVTCSVEEADSAWILTTGVLEVAFAKADGTMTVKDLRSGRKVLEQLTPVDFGTRGGQGHCNCTA